MKGYSKLIVLMGLLVTFILPLGVTPLSAWETPFPLANTDGHTYFKPETAFLPSGAIYTVYRDKAPTGESDIMGCYYDGKELVYENVSEGSKFFRNYKCYESDIDVTPDGKIYVAWVIHDINAKAVHYIKYRIKNGNTWSPIYNLGSIQVTNNDVLFDTRLGVDSHGNVHVIIQEEFQTVIHYMAQYGNTILAPVTLDSPGARIKHPDLAVDNNYVHMIWMKKMGYPYVIMYQKRENKVNGTWGPVRQITFPKGEFASQKSRIDVGSDGYVHLAEFYKTGIVKKLKYYKENQNGNFLNATTVSHPTDLLLYHWAGLEVRDNSIIATMQLGGSNGGFGIFYNWNRNGIWQGYKAIDNTDGAVHQSTDLSFDGDIAAVAYGRFDTSIMLVTSAPIETSSPLQASFTHPASAFYGDTVTFDATPCSQLNPGIHISAYKWDFGDGSNLTTTTPTVTHAYSSYGVDIPVTLTIVSDTGNEGEADSQIHINALYSAIITSVQSTPIKTLFVNRTANRITWEANPKNTQAGYPAITNYRIYRAPVSSTLTDNDYVLIREVSTSVTQFLDYNGLLSGSEYVYAIVCIDNQGHVSPLHNQ